MSISEATATESIRGAEFEGRHVLVVGGAAGIGAAVVARLQSEGAVVDVFDRVSPDRPVPGAEYTTADVRNAESVEAAVKKVLQHRGTIDGLVYAAGVLDGYATLEEIGEELMSTVLDVNVVGAVRVIQAVAPHMKRAGYGRIVLFDSIAGAVGGAGGIAYTMSKHAVGGLTKHLALELGGFGITTNSVAPGSITGTKIRTNIEEILGAGKVATNRGLGTMSPEDAAKQYPVGRLGSIESVVPSVLHLLAESSWFINGSTVTIDGGFTAK